MAPFGLVTRMASLDAGGRSSRARSRASGGVLSAAATNVRRRISASRGAVLPPCVLSQPGVEIDLPLRDREEHHEGLKADLRYGVLAQHGVEAAPALQVEQPLRLEGQLPAALPVHRIPELVLTQTGQRRQLGTSPHLIDRAVRVGRRPVGLVLRLGEHQQHVGVAIDRKSTRLNFQSRSDLVCRLLLEKKKIIEGALGMNENPRQRAYKGQVPRPMAGAGTTGREDRPASKSRGLARGKPFWSGAAPRG